MQVVLLQVAPAGVASVVARLAEHGIEAEAIDHPNVFALLAAFGTYRVRIAVDEADEPRAREVLAVWSEEARPRVAALARIVVLDSLVALVPALGVGATLFFAGRQVAGALAVPVTWFLAMLVLARWRRWRGAA